MSIDMLAAAVVALKEQLRGAIEQEAARLIVEGGGPCTFTLATTNGAIQRGALAYENDWGGDPKDLDGDAGIAFSLIHALGETAAMRRVKLALTDPRSRGREIAVIEALTDGADIETAITLAKRPPSEPDPGDGGNVVPLRR